MRTAEFARGTGIPRRTIQHMIERGELRLERPGKPYEIDPGEIGRLGRNGGDRLTAELASAERAVRQIAAELEDRAPRSRKLELRIVACLRLLSALQALDPVQIGKVIQERP